jgi:ubiquinone/menaquinone biosynthesis C-methylase UbiE
MKLADQFFEESMKKIFTEGSLVVDIGGGLRTDPSRNNRKKENAWLDPYIAKVDFKILDKVADYHPDIVGDIHDLPFEDNSVDAIICVSVLEHVEEPQKAVKEMHRVLKPGGYCYIYAPFLFYYHPVNGYYEDYYRFTLDGMRYLTRDFKEVEVHNARGALATVFNLFPFFSKKVGPFEFLDKVFGKERSNQTSGYSLLAVK